MIVAGEDLAHYKAYIAAVTDCLLDGTLVLRNVVLWPHLPFNREKSLIKELC